MDSYVSRFGRRARYRSVTLSPAVSVSRRFNGLFVNRWLRNEADLLNQSVKELDIDDRFKFTGYVSRERLTRLFQNAMAFVLPSEYEGLPTVLLETVAFGAPAVATEVGGCPEVIKDRDNDLLVALRDLPALAKAMERLIRNASLRERLGTNSRGTIFDRYTRETVTDAFGRKYRLAIETG